MRVESPQLVAGFIARHKQIRKMISETYGFNLGIMLVIGGTGSDWATNAPGSNTDNYRIVGLEQHSEISRRMFQELFVKKCLSNHPQSSLQPSDHQPLSINGLENWCRAMHGVAMGNPRCMFFLIQHLLKKLKQQEFPGEPRKALEQVAHRYLDTNGLSKLEQWGQLDSALDDACLLLFLQDVEATTLSNQPPDEESETQCEGQPTTAKPSPDIKRSSTTSDDVKSLPVWDEKSLCPFRCPGGQCCGMRGHCSHRMDRMGSNTTCCRCRIRRLVVIAGIVHDNGKELKEGTTRYSIPLALRILLMVRMAAARGAFLHHGIQL